MYTYTLIQIWGLGGRGGASIVQDVDVPVHSFVVRKYTSLLVSLAVDVGIFQCGGVTRILGLLL